MVCGMSKYSLKSFSNVVDVSIRTDDYELLASEIADKTSSDVAEYYPVFQDKWSTLTGTFYR